MDFYISLFSVTQLIFTFFIFHTLFFVTYSLSAPRRDIVRALVIFTLSASMFCVITLSYGPMDATLWETRVLTILIFYVILLGYIIYLLYSGRSNRWLAFLFASVSGMNNPGIYLSLMGLTEELSLMMVSILCAGVLILLLCLFIEKYLAPKINPASKRTIQIAVWFLILTYYLIQIFRITT